MIFFLPLFWLLLVDTSLASSSSKRSSSRNVREHREVARQCSSGPQRPLGEPRKPGNVSSGQSGLATVAAGAFKQDIIYKGEDFLSQWNFFTGPDATHGLVNYQSLDDARSKGLAYVDGGVTVLAVDNHTVLQPGQNRDSVRISSSKTWNGGLFIADFAQMPVGCSIWPAYWSVGKFWPQHGEIDVLEGVHNQSTNQYTLHTSEGCTASHGSQITGTPGATSQCATIGSDNTGCAYYDTDTRSYGNGFNAAGGGVFAHLWDYTGIKIWHFSRNEIPENIQSELPDPSSWGPPAAFWSSDTCNMAQHFQNHSLVIDTTLCGDWAGATYASAGCPGTCEQAVADPKNFQDAQWQINSIVVYQAA